MLRHLTAALRHLGSSGGAMTLPPRPQDWPEDARHVWLERVAMRLEQWHPTPTPEAVRHAEREAEGEVRAARRGR